MITVAAVAVAVVLSRAARHTAPLAAQVERVYVCFVSGHLLADYLTQKEASHSLRPLTVAQILKATQAHADAEWTVDDSEIGQV